MWRRIESAQPLSSYFYVGRKAGLQTTGSGVRGMVASDCDRGMLISNDGVMLPLPVATNYSRSRVGASNGFNSAALTSGAFARASNLQTN